MRLTASCSTPTAGDACCAKSPDHRCRRPRAVLSSQPRRLAGGRRAVGDRGAHHRAGDYATGAQTDGVLSGVAAADPDAHLALGDLKYASAPTEQAWCDYVLGKVGPSFSFELVAGNHENDGSDGNINDFSACLPNQLPGVVGVYGRQWYVDVPQVDPLVRIVMISPGLAFPDGTTWSYAAGTPRLAWTLAAIDRARTALNRRLVWVCGMRG